MPRKRLGELLVQAGAIDETKLRAALAEPGRRNLLLEQLKPGDCVMGTVIAGIVTGSDRDHSCCIVLPEVSHALHVATTGVASVKFIVRVPLEAS